MGHKPSWEFKSVPFVLSHIDAAAKEVALEAGDQFSLEMSQRLESASAEDAPAYDLRSRLEFDSPLEAAFWVWWMAWRKMDIFAEENIYLERHVDVTVGMDHYVLDFVVRNRPRESAKFIDAEWPRIGIELDGHTFHEKTLDQVTYRNQRDRALQQAGWHIFHYSFSEFNNDPSSCVLGVVEFARDIYWKLIRKHSTPDA